MMTIMSIALIFYNSCAWCVDVFFLEIKKTNIYSAKRKNACCCCCCCCSINIESYIVFLHVISDKMTRATRLFALICLSVCPVSAFFQTSVVLAYNNNNNNRVDVTRSAETVELVL